MASETELIEAIRRAGRAGDGAAVRALGRELERVRQKPPEGWSWGDLKDAAVNTAAGAVQGLAAIPDAVTDAYGGYQRLKNQTVGNLTSAALDATGLRNQAAQQRRATAAQDRYLYNARPNVGEAVERLAPTPKTTAGRIARLGAQMLGGAAVPLGRKAPTLPSFPKAAPRTAKQVPSVEHLKKQADELYDLAEAKGIAASRDKTAALSQRFRQIAADEGLISPTGRVSTAYPKAGEALKLAEDYAQGTMKPAQMKTVRKVLSDAAGSPDNSERRIARMMLKDFDDWTAPLAPEFEQARAVARRYISAGKIEDAIEAANARASQFSGSGMENALRTEFRGLDRKILKGQERGFIPEVEQAIQNVSRGTRASNTARNIGKLAPTGVVSAGLATGVPFAVGNAIGGPGVGGAFSAATMGAGLLGRRAATNMALKNAELAALIARNGGNLASAPSIGADSLVTPFVKRGLLAASPRTASLLDMALTPRLAADEEREREKKKKKR